MKTVRTENYKRLEKAITYKMTGKMEGMASLSTSPLCNPNCIKRMNAGETVCAHCFSARMQKRYKNLNEKLVRNTEFLTTTELTPDDVPFLNMSLFRFESFGDLNNALQVKNYFTIAEANSHCTFALWTKNPWIIEEAINEYGINKPDNLIIILSSVLLNTPTTPGYDFIDKVFTVYDKKAAESVNINCGARSCATCRRCYTKTNGVEYVNELLK
jgi:hypothetical protein